jgi:hypothetical protein
MEQRSLSELCDSQAAIDTSRTIDSAEVSLAMPWEGSSRVTMGRQIGDHPS